MSTFRPLLRAPYLLTSSLRTCPVHRTFSTASPLQSSVAKIHLIGRLAAEAELAATSDGTDMIRYSLATNSGSKENRKTSWWKIASFAGEGRGRDILLSLGKGSVSLREFFVTIYELFGSKKGGLGFESLAGRGTVNEDSIADVLPVGGDEFRSMLYVEGDAQMNQFKDKNGNSQSALSIVQRRFDVLDRRDKSETGEGEIGEGEGGEGESRRL